MSWLESSGGGWVIDLLLAASVLSIAIMLDRIIVIWRQAKYQKSVLRQLDEKLQSSNPSAIPSLIRPDAVLRPIVDDLLKHRSKGKPVLQERLETQIALQKRRLEKNVLILGTLGNNAPFIGLLGTVLGVIHAFRDLAASSGHPEVVMEGLAEALVATAVGIMVALPCVAAYNYIQKRVKDVLIDADHFGKQLIAVLVEH